MTQIRFDFKKRIFSGKELIKYLLCRNKDDWLMTINERQKTWFCASAFFPSSLGLNNIVQQIIFFQLQFREVASHFFHNVVMIPCVFCNIVPKKWDLLLESRTERLSYKLQNWFYSQKRTFSDNCVILNCFLYIFSQSFFVKGLFLLININLRWFRLFDFDESFVFDMG